jgi:DNA primase
VASVSAAVPDGLQPLVGELAVAGLPVQMDPVSGAPDRRYVDGLLARVIESGLQARVADAMSALRRLDSAEQPDPDRQRQVARELQLLQRELADLRARAGG